MIYQKNQEIFNLK